MIFVTKSRGEKPLFTGFVNGVNEKKISNGGTIKSYIIGTSEKKLNSDLREYSSWFCTMIGQARKDCEKRQLVKGDRVEIYGFKQTNISKKNDDGTWGKSFFNFCINDYVLIGDKDNEVQSVEDNPF